MKEIWKDIEGYDGQYQVSTQGRVRRVYFTRILKQQINKKSGGYLYISLKKLGTRKNKTIQVHRFVAETFMLNPENKPCVNHKDGKKLNNKLENLEWVTRSENTKHAFRTGLIRPRKGSEHFKAKLVEDDARQIRVLRKKGFTYPQLAKLFKVSESLIGGIIRGERWIF